MEYPRMSTLCPPGVSGHQPPAVNIFTLYEQNIGMITPMIAEELKEAEKLYPPRWIEEAFKEAVTLNKRSWRYIARILERWASEGKDSGEHKRDIKKMTQTNTSRANTGTSSKDNSPSTGRGLG
jgi:DNA replication protein